MSASISINCTGEGGAAVKCTGKDVKVRLVSQDGKELYDSEKSESYIIADCDENTKKNYLLEIKKPETPDFTLDISRGKNGGWYAAGKHLIGGVLTVIIVDTKNGNLYLLDPASYAEKLSNIKSQALLDKKSEELFITLKSSLPGSMFDKLPVKVLKKNKYLK